MSTKSHDSGIGAYLGVFVALMVLTALTVWAAFLHLGVWNTPVALAIAVTKALGSKVKTTFKEDSLDNWSTYFEMVTPQLRAQRIAALTADSKGHELWATLEVRPSDLIVEKNRFSAFIHKCVEARSNVFPL